MSSAVPTSTYLKRKFLYFKRSVLGDLLTRPVRRGHRVRYIRGI